MEIQRSPGLMLGSYSTVKLEKNNEPRPGAKTAPNTSEGAQGDTVSVSQDALLLTEARRTAQNSPDVRTEKVEALRVRVANGTYQPDSRSIAAGLLREDPGVFRA